MVDNIKFTYDVDCSAAISYIYEMVEWCGDNLDAEYITWDYILCPSGRHPADYEVTFSFENEDDAIMFKLKFG